MHLSGWIGFGPALFRWGLSNHLFPWGTKTTHRTMETLKQAVCLKPWLENSTQYQSLPEPGLLNLHLYPQCHQYNQPHDSISPGT